MRKYSEIFNEVLKRIKLSKKEHLEIEKTVNSIVNKIYSEIAEYIESKEDIFIGGSFSRNTVIKDDFDIDIFIRFPPKMEIKKISKLVIKLSERIFGKEAIKLRFAEHPYVEVMYNNLSLNIVPSYKVDAPNWLSAVDRSYYHTLYLERNFKDYMVDEALLLKSFLRGIKCYGAEVTKKGFSGYLTELLIIKYGSFVNLINEASSKWRRQVIIDKDGYTKKELNILFPNASMIYLDPVDKKRNVASAVSNTSLARFISASKAFVRNPRKEFFYPFSEEAYNNHIQQISIDEIIKLPIILIYLTHSEEIEDIFYSQLEKLMRKVAKQLRLHNVEILKMNSYSNFKNKSIIAYLVSSRYVKELRKYEGPLVYISSEHDFLSKNKDKPILWISDDFRWYKIGYVKHRDVKELLMDILEHNVVLPSHIEDADINIFYINELPIIWDREVISWIKEFIAGVEFWRNWI